MRIIFPEFKRIFLKIIADSTRQHILEILQNGPPQNPADLATKLGLTRPGVEKHLKVLRDYLLVEREVDPWTPKFIYTITYIGIDFLNHLTDLMDNYLHEATQSIENQLELLEDRFVLGKIDRTQYEEQVKRLKKAQNLFKV